MEDGGGTTGHRSDDTSASEAWFRRLGKITPAKKGREETNFGLRVSVDTDELGQSGRSPRPR